MFIIIDLNMFCLRPKCTVLSEDGVVDEFKIKNSDLYKKNIFIEICRKYSISQVRVSGSPSQIIDKLNEIYEGKIKFSPIGENNEISD